MMQVFKQWIDEHWIARKSRSGRQKVTLERDDRHLVRMEVNGSAASSRQLTTRSSSRQTIEGCIYNGLRNTRFCKLIGNKLSFLTKSTLICGTMMTAFASRPIFEKETPTLHGWKRHSHNVDLHSNVDSGRLSKSIVTYLAKKESKTGIKCIAFDETHVKSPYASAMNFCVFGILKQALEKRHPRKLNGLWKTFQEEWSTI
ncbi:hypothetical protein TNCV_527061 [Trichonephila clavipes]|nr:hypothetical protein TNCV_527061 [Trichonephila clavipes]